MVGYRRGVARVYISYLVLLSRGGSCVYVISRVVLMRVVFCVYGLPVAREWRVEVSDGEAALSDSSARSVFMAMPLRQDK